MAKEKKDDITFDNLANLDLNLKSNIEEVKLEKTKETETTSPKIERGRGRPKLEKEVVKTSFKVEKDLHRKLKIYCMQQGVNMSDFVFEELVRSHLEKQGVFSK